MNRQRTKQAASPKVKVDRVTPDFQSWGDLHEVKKLTIALVLRSLGRATIRELAVILAMIALFFLGRDLIATAGGQTPSARVLACVFAVALLIVGLALYLHRATARSRNDAENLEGAEGPPQSGDE